ncbi:hypothetical protein [Rhizorhabdus sp.]|nr:hypothetical protein [Rhizorhabdus sp.]
MIEPLRPEPSRAWCGVCIMAVVFFLYMLSGVANAWAKGLL